MTLIDRLKETRSGNALVPVALSTFAVALAARRRGHDSLGSLLALGTGGLLAAGGEHLVTAIVESHDNAEPAPIYDFKSGKRIA